MSEYLLVFYSSYVEWVSFLSRRYVSLISRGLPDLIEVKGVTYCGASPGSTLTMADVPWHAEVRDFCEAMCAKLGGDYALAAEHAHSCCILIAKTKFRSPEGVWHTHIDYDRFHALVQRYYESDGKETFTSEDYVAPTPGWAVYDAPEAGFDPAETRHAYKSSESGCG
jgi:tRNA wybutosine-synthesizing protein 1